MSIDARGEYAAVFRAQCANHVEIVFNGQRDIATSGFFFNITKCRSGDSQHNQTLCVDVLIIIGYCATLTWHNEYNLHT